MKHRFLPSSLLLLVLSLTPLVPLEQAHAYLDPGTGSALLQVLLAGVAGIAVCGKLCWRYVTTWFGATFGKGAPAESTGPTQDIK